MWPDGEAESGLGRASSGSEVVIMDERMLSLANASSPSQINVTGSNLVHVGPKFVSVNQTVHNREVVKGRFLGHELISPKKSNKLRCSIMVFVCWAVVVASGFSFYLVHYIFLQQTRHDLDTVIANLNDRCGDEDSSVLDIISLSSRSTPGVCQSPQLSRVQRPNFTFWTPRGYSSIGRDSRDLSLPMYLWSVLKSTTRAERLSCAAAIIFLTICVTLIIVYVLNKRDPSLVTDTHDPNDWNISRIQWLAQHWHNPETTEQFEPLRLVIIQHSVSTECYTFQSCAAEMRILQNYFIKKLDYDIPYNFLIGNDGRVYEGRGWRIVGAHTQYYNKCSLGIGFVGDYREELSAHATVTPLQVKRTQMLLDYGVLKGYLHPDFHVLAAKDIKDTASPGSNLYNELRTWRHYNNGSNYKNKSCEQMYSEFNEKDI